jgi:hypothetical protein
MTVDPNDYRLADFKLLLPLRPDARTLVIAAEETRFLRHLAGELRDVHAVGTEPDSPSAPQLTSGASANATVRRLAQPEGLYDLVFSDSLEAARHLRPGGTLCQLASDPGTHALPLPTVCNGSGAGVPSRRGRISAC